MRAAAEAMKTRHEEDQAVLKESVSKLGAEVTALASKIREATSPLEGVASESRALSGR
jgi:hypothetical protein